MSDWGGWNQWLRVLDHFSEFYLLFVFRGYNGNGICDDEVPTDGKTWRSATYHYHIPFGLASWTFPAGTISG
jgi:hypothetical protein